MSVASWVEELVDRCLDEQLGTSEDMNVGGVATYVEIVVPFGVANEEEGRWHLRNHRLNSSKLKRRKRRDWFCI
jgi:hypothetical protein